MKGRSGIRSEAGYAHQILLVRLGRKRGISSTAGHWRLDNFLASLYGARQNVENAASTEAPSSSTTTENGGDRDDGVPA